MSHSVAPELVESVVQGLLGATDVDGGPTVEQLAVVRAITTHLWGRPDLDPGSMAATDAAVTAAAVTDEGTRRRFHEMLFTLEACRHPLTVGQVERAEQYATALGADGPDLALFRTFVTDGRARASADFDRFLAGNIASRHEPGLSEVPPDAPEPELAARVHAFADLPADSLGRAYLAFYERHHLALPGEEATSFNHFFVSHDMTHVIAGIEPTAAGEIAVSAMQLGMDDNSINVGALLASLVVHEAGIGASPTFGSEAFVLADPVAADLLGRSLARGAACAGDFSLADHFALAPRPLADVRAEFGVPAPGNPDDGHHCW